MNLKFLLRGFVFLSLFSTAFTSVFGQILIDSPSFTYNENFDGLSNTGAANTWTNNSTVPGWYSTLPNYRAETGSGTTGALYSFGSTSATDRALGSLASGGTGTIYYGVRLKNTAPGYTLTSLTISYDGEQWRNGGNTTAQTLNVSYQVGAVVTSLTTGTYIPVNALNFTGPIATASAGALDGNAAANRIAGISTTITLTIPEGQEVMIRWEDLNDAGNDHGLALDNFSITMVTLPVTLLTFNAKSNTNSSHLTFSTATEHNNSYFAIERSADGARFEAIGKVTGAGNSTVQQDYTYTDEHPLKGLNFYRLKQVDFDGQFSYSPVVSVTFGQTGGIRLAPQPVADQLQVSLEQPTGQDGQWQVYDFAGRLVQSGTLDAESTGFQVPTATFTEGSYVLRIVSGQTVLTQQFQKR